ncbi:type II toxin-antitoxin system RelE/ParE family toxin [Mucilaginibacter sp. FT3.2]|uniref:type II toxin-antitoxin system RelE/ParE family toxin n=1 Tax=Mucilaginibacter sp. FT3.2 TaxID=2723090 RepID=UPI0016106F1C|nr:type II toxin-antitoxin system RelE/ParE family toxin [Mucilaginibacter sp. FT3.2]MBB6231883.1 mRNA-degrading endonuclease RelE of RelBE toxin-antitoxin system [Mucilaginibacter sp. FT3.2]
MPNKVFYTPVFIKKAKDLKKKHSSLLEDLKIFQELLINDPKQGVALGGGLYKVRLAIKSKGKGKSGGYRIITYLVSESNEDVLINMLTLYDKSEESTINKQFLLKLIREHF